MARHVPAAGAALALLLGTFSVPALAGKANDTLVYASDTEPENVSPYHNSAREGVVLARNVWDTLLYRDPKTGGVSADAGHRLEMGRPDDPRTDPARGRDLP